MDPGSLVGIVGVAVELFNLSLAGYKLLSDLSSVGRDASFMTRKLKVEEYRLQYWGEQSGLTQKNIDHFLSNRALLAAVIDTLSCIADISTNVRNLEKLYGLQGTQRAASPPPTSAASSLSEPVHDILGLSLVTSNVDRAKCVAQRLENSLSFMRKFRWAIRDRTRLQNLVSELIHFNNTLHTRIRRCTTLRDTEEAVRPEYPDLAASAGMKALSIKLEAKYDRDPELRREIPITPLATHTQCGQLSLGTYKPSYDAASHRPVLVSWKQNGRFDDVPGTEQRRIVHGRVENLARLLHTGKAEELRMLQCYGYVWNSDRVGFLFGLPHGGDPTQLPVTLNSLLQSSTSSKSSVSSTACSNKTTRQSRPDLGDRFTLAALLAGSMFRLHRSNWLHKGWSSHHILFFHSKETSISSPYVIGLDYTRWDSAVEVSEHPLSGPGYDLYRHPEVQSFSPTRFERKHDLYSLGLVLFEIGYWAPLRSYTRSKDTASSFSAWLMQSPFSGLGFRMGAKYQNVVRKCLQGPSEEDLVRYEYSDTEGQPYLKWFYWEILSELESCRA
ncbi:prion-inhibition and propagation-domain-containing protein [Aspergillus karnatakaensis]|uniref:prion-inhibition and propagation-domain-containing protein n=1 Tax=Aspergillus karnatakaensis TaxID=1810916 RepID=UPI003CCDE117